MSDKPQTAAHFYRRWRNMLNHARKHHGGTIISSGNQGFHWPDGTLLTAAEKIAVFCWDVPVSVFGEFAALARERRERINHA